MGFALLLGPLLSGEGGAETGPSKSNPWVRGSLSARRLEDKPWGSGLPPGRRQGHGLSSVFGVVPASVVRHEKGNYCQGIRDATRISFLVHEFTAV